MQRKRKHSPYRSMSVAAVLLYLLLASTCVFSGMYARFTTSADAADDARVAAFVFDVQDTAHITSLEEIKKPGDSQSFEFTLTNSRGGISSEVAEKYTILFEELGSLPLTYTLTDVTDSANPVPVFTDSRTESDTSINTQTNNGTMQASVEADKSYKLTVTWPEDKKDAKYASGSGVASLKIEILAEQLD